MSETMTGLNSPILGAAAGEMPRQLEALFDWVRAYDTQEAAWAFVLLLTGFLAGRFLAGVSLRGMARAVARTEWRFDDALVLHLAAPLRWTLPLLLLRGFLPLVALPEATLAWMSHALLVALILCVGWIAARFLRLGEDYWVHQYRIDTGDNLK